MGPRSEHNEVEMENMAKVYNTIMELERERLRGRTLRSQEMHRIREKRKDLRQGMSLITSRNIEREKRRVAIEKDIAEGNAPPRWYNWKENLKDPIPSVAKQSWIQARKISDLSSN